MDGGPLLPRRHRWTMANITDRTNGQRTQHTGVTSKRTIIRGAAKHDYHSVRSNV